MRIAIFGSARISHSQEELQSLIELLGRHSDSYFVNSEFASQITHLTTADIDTQMIYSSAEEFPNDVDYVISYGGDGTFLDCVKVVADRQIPILGVNSGRLGFLANVTKEGFEDALIDLKNKNYRLETHSLLKLSGMEHLVDYPYALNEIGIQKGEVNMIDVEVAIDDEFVASYRGDGVLFATPTGSTAYSLSVGGPIVSPNAECLVIAPIAPHTLTMRPLVIPNKVKLTIRPHSRNQRHFLTLDNRSYVIPNGCQFNISKAERSIILIQLQNNSFYRTLRNKMMWGVDRRDGLL